MDNALKFEVPPDKMIFNTQTNGDKIMIHGVHLKPEQAAILATLINGGEPVTVNIEGKV
jgi:hypothetical protein